MIELVLIAILIALIFDFLNGFHDSANSIATIVSTHVLAPKYAVIWAAFFNFAAAFTLEVKVAETIGSGIVEIGSTDIYVLIAGLIGAMVFRNSRQFFSRINRRVRRSSGF
jgi:PiT family inorganic phosphate transporter